jgi:hypothetical protein
MAFERMRRYTASFSAGPARRTAHLSSRAHDVAAQSTTLESSIERDAYDVRRLFGRGMFSVCYWEMAASRLASTFRAVQVIAQCSRLMTMERRFAFPIDLLLSSPFARTSAWRHTRRHTGLLSYAAESP